MKNTLSFFKQLIEDETYFENVSSLANHSAADAQHVYRLASSLLLVCLHQQLQTDLGRGLVLRILGKHAQFGKPLPDVRLTNIDELTALAVEGNRLLGTLLPGKKSVIMGIIIHSTKLPFKPSDLLVGLCAYTLFTKLAMDSVSETEPISLVASIDELEEFAPELRTKEYIAVGAYAIL